jgi:HEAT repeat protein
VSEPEEQPASPADRRDRRVYVWWGAGLVLLVGLALFCQFLLRPYLEVRSALRAADRKSYTWCAETVQRLGGPTAASRKLAFYLRLPQNWAPQQDLVEMVGPECGRDGVPAFVNLLASSRPYARMIAAWVLGQSEDPRAVEPLIRALHDQDDDVRGVAITELVRVWAKDPRLVEPLIAALRDRDQRVRREAARGLEDIRDERIVEPLIRALSDQDAVVRVEAAWALGSGRYASACEPLMRTLVDQDSGVRQDAARALGKLGDARAVRALVSALRDDNANVRYDAALALGWMKDPQAIELLIAALGDQDDTVRSGVVGALGAIGPPAKAAIPSVQELATSDPSELVRQAAAEALKKIRSQQKE